MRPLRRVDARMASSLYAYLGISAEAQRLEERSWRFFRPGGAGVVLGLAAAWATKYPEVAEKLTDLQEDVINKGGFAIAGLGLVAMVLGLRDSSQALGQRQAALGSIPPPLPPPLEFRPDTITEAQAAQIDGFAEPARPIDLDQL